MRLIENGRARSAFLVLALSLLMAGDAWRYTLGWWTFGVLGVAMAVASVWLLVVARDRWRVSTLPYPVLAFMVLATLSLAWSHYRLATLLGLLTTWLIAIAAVAITVTYSWSEILNGLSVLLRWVLGLSLAFELFVSVVLQRPVLPLFTQPGVDYSIYDTLPKMLYWSRNELFQVFDAGRIQGIVGNANHLGFLALIATIVFCLQLADRTITRRWGAFWLAIAAVALVFTRSATVTAALVAVVFVAVAVVLVRRARSSRQRSLTIAGILAVIAVGITAIVLLHSTLLGLLGKSDDLTGRVGIWEKVIALAQQRPAVGWGWVSYWVPWAEPFDTLAFRNGVRQLQAHNAWLDLWLQLGIFGIIVFAAIVLSSLQRSWSFATDRPQSSPAGPLPYAAAALFPLLLLVALLVQSAAESRMLVEFGLFFVIVIAVKTKPGNRQSVL